MRTFNGWTAALAVAGGILLATVFTGSLQAQVHMGGLTGTIKDPSGALIARANLTLTDEATNVMQKARSSSTGTYAFEAVPAGSYALKAEA